jgi:6,7-dimethyl-8-ribityllumazine synthase
MTSLISADPDAARVAFVQACWHREIVDACRDAFLAAMTAADGPAVELFEVPGAFELPLHAQLLASTGRYRAVVAAGFVVDGGIYRHDFVGRAVIDGLMRVQLDSGVPVLSAVLTPHHFHDHDAHESFFLQHMVTKGDEVARACLATCASVESLLSPA